ncbi:recombinase family protein [Mycobacterium paraintracellulare]|uniref:Integrase n=1 Tax=Mycobacterium paraintracellulare TaxID=1138383 RepID=A0ABM7K840_9MYCO|nr:recombinase family protein [Mycobacterium paraintracellulare]OSC26918.1 recombinase family protein [Mycobacterium paraintracellulare]BBY70126.1 integrase [Mycobacterium paraintracellulare]
MTLRALVVIRLSRVTDETTSPERQREACEQLCRERGFEIVDVATDLDVSGSVDPFTRPVLGRWLAERHDKFDCLVAWRVDRLTRSIRHLRRLVDWAEDHGKLIVSATEPHFDMASPFAAVLIALLGTVAEMELAAISERNRSAARHNIKAGKYRGGLPPWGYVPDKSSGEWRLIKDDEQVVVIEEVVKRVLRREPLRSIAHDLTERGVPTPKDSFAKRQGREAKGLGWSSGRLKQSLTSEALLGYAMSGGQPVRAEDGSPIIRAEPILTRDKFDRLRKELESRENRKEPYARTTALLLRVIYCGCGKQMYSLKGGKGRQYRYRCASAQYKTNCGGPSCLAPEADQLVETSILQLLGDSERLEKEWDAGDDHSAELADVDAELADLAGQLGTAAFRPGTPQRLRLNDRIERLSQRQAELSRDVSRPAGWVWRPTGERFGDWWASQDVVGRNVWLRDAGVRLIFDGRYNLDLGDVETMTKQLQPAGAIAEYQRMFAAMTESGIAGTEINGDDVVIHYRDGTTERVTLA